MTYSISGILALLLYSCLSLDDGYIIRKVEKAADFVKKDPQNKSSVENEESSPSVRASLEKDDTKATPDQTAKVHLTRLKETLAAKF